MNSKDESQPYDLPTEADRYQMIRTYFQMLLEEEIHGTEGKMKQFASWFTHGIPGGAALRKAIYDAHSGAEILQSVERFFEGRVQTASEITSKVSSEERGDFASANLNLSERASEPCTG